MDKTPGKLKRYIKRFLQYVAADARSHQGRFLFGFTIAMQCIDLPHVLPAILPRLWSFALRLTENEYQAEELVQRACKRGLESAWPIAHDASPLNWMFSIVCSIWREDMRERMQRHCVHAVSNVMRSGANTRSAARTDEAVGHAISAIGRLTQTQRIAMLLVNAEGLDYEQAAGVLGVDVSVVKNRLCTARKLISASCAARQFPAQGHMRAE